VSDEIPRIDTNDISGAMAHAACGTQFTLRPGQRIGSYTLEAIIGNGSFGAVWRATQQVPFQRTVAIKILHDSANSERILIGFRREQRILAQLDHPNIVTILDAGITESGNPWYSMTWVDGQPVDRLDWKGAARVFAEIAETVQFAHDNNVLHCDIKPHNLLLDNLGRVRMIDFGLAAVQSHAEGLDANLTIARAVGTPAHMAPEQLDGRSIDARTDVYGVGGALLSVLTGRPPHDVGGMPLHTALTVVAEQEVRFPRGEADVPDDLRAVVLKATAWNPEDRYVAAAALADDLRRVLAGIPPEASHPGLVQRLWRGCRRRPAFAVAAATAITAVVGGLIVALLLLEAQWSARYKAESAGARAMIAVAAAAVRNGDLSSASLCLQAIPLAQRHWEWDLLNTQTSMLQEVIATAQGDVLSLAVDAPGERLAAATTDTIAVIDLHTNDVTWLRTESEGPVWWSVCWLPDGRLVAGDNHGEVVVFDLEAASHERTFLGTSALGIAALPSGATAVATGTDVVLLNPDTMEIENRRSISNGHLYTLQLVNDRLLAADSNGDVFALDSSLTGDVQRRHVHDHRIHRLVLNSDKTKMVAVSNDHTATVMDPQTLDVDTRLLGHRAAVWDAHWMDDGSILTASTDYTIRQWDPVSGSVIRSYSSPQQHVWSLAQSPDGRIWSGGHDWTIRAWVLDDVAEETPWHQGPVIHTMWSSDGTMLATLGSHSLMIQGGSTIAVDGATMMGWIGNGSIAVGFPDGRVAAFDAQSGEASWNCAPCEEALTALGVVGEFIVVGCGDASVHSLNGTTGQLLASTHRQNAPHRDVDITAITAGAHPATVILGSRSDVTEIRSMPQLELLRSWKSRVARTTALDAQPRGDWILIGGAERPENLRLWNAVTGDHIRGFIGHANTISGARWHPTDDRFVTAGKDGRLLLWDPMVSTQLLEVADIGVRAFTSLDVHPTTGQIAAGTSDGVVLLYPNDPAPQDRSSRHKEK